MQKIRGVIIIGSHEESKFKENMQQEIERFFEDFEDVTILGQSQTQFRNTVTLIITFTGTQKNPPE